MYIINIQKYFVFVVFASVVLLSAAPLATKPVDFAVFDSGSVQVKRYPIDSLGSNTVVTAGTGITVNRSNDTFEVSLYEPPEILTFTNNAATNYAGQTVTDVTTNWTLSGASITGQTHTDVSPDPDTADRSHVFTGLSLTIDKTYKLWVTDGVTPDSAYTYVRFYIATFYGNSANAVPTEANVEAGTSTWETQSSVNRALSAVSITSASQYVFYSYPKSWGQIDLYAGGFKVNWPKDSLSITNAYGDTRDYYTYTSPTVLVGETILSAVAK